MKNIVLLLGGNIGDRVSFFQQAILLIEKQIGKIIKASSFYETAAWGNENQPAFLNQVVYANTELQPEDVLNSIISIEKSLGRKRDTKWQERTIDIDILFYENQIIETKTLSIPHPWLHQRRFTLVPLVEILPNLVHPKLNKTTWQLLEECEDTLAVRRCTPLNFTL